MEKKTLLRVLVGSRAHGLERPDSDYDYRGVYVVPTSEILKIGHSYKGKSWIEGKEDDTSYEIGHFLHLATKANPSILEVLVADEEKETSKYAKDMRALLPYLYNPKDAYNAFTGYSANQRTKLFKEDGDRKYKYAVAYIRTLLNLNSLLSSGTFALKVTKEEHITILKQIRDGEVSIGDIINLCMELTQAADKLLLGAENKQDLNKVNDFLLSIRKDFWEI